MHSVCRCSLPVWRRSFLKRGTPRDLFWPRPGSAPGGIWPKNNNTCKGPWVLHPYQVSSKSIQRFWRRSRKCEKFTDGRTDDGRCAMTIAHSSLRLRWAKNYLPTENLKINGQHKNATKNFDYTTIADWFRTVSWSNNIHPTGVVKSKSLEFSEQLLAPEYTDTPRRDQVPGESQLLLFASNNSLDSSCHGKQGCTKFNRSTYTQWLAKYLVVLR